MFNSPVLDLVILLSFTYFIGSLILSAINEAIAGTFRLRQRDLGKGLMKFFLNSEWRLFIKNTFLKSPHIQTLMSSKDRLPAYIPARNFVLGLIENIDGVSYKDGIIKSNPVSINSTKDILPQEMQTVMKTIMMQVSNIPIEGRLQEFEKRLEEFYNNTMDRVTGWYKRRVRRILLAIGLLLAVVLNIDTIKIANDAMKDKTRLSKAVDNITSKLPRIDSFNNIAIAVSDTDGKINIKKTLINVDSAVISYNEISGYQLGYNGNFKEEWSHHFWKKLLGVLLTAFALQLGSNYWFDLMNKAVNVRAAGKKPDEKKETKTSK